MRCLLSCRASWNVSSPSASILLDLSDIFLLDLCLEFVSTQQLWRASLGLSTGVEVCYALGMAEIERPLTVNEAAARSGRHRNTILRWIYSGQLKTTPPPLGRGRGKFCTVADLERACTEKLVKFKQPRRPHLARKREIDRERWRTKYAKTEKTRAYKRAYYHYRKTLPSYIKWREEYYARKKKAGK